MDSHQYLLDTNILSHLIRFPTGPVLNRLESILPASACTSIVVSAEIHYGLTKKGSASLTRQARRILKTIDVLPLEYPVDEHYGDIRTHLEKVGAPIGGNDLFIAAHARALGLILVTDNIKEFSRVPDLLIENWMEK
ncbi:MAG: type II toxin-antitoxin system VapC family toxin [Thermodesulfobacteriota bacterium]